MHVFHIVVNRGAGYARNQIRAGRDGRTAVAKECAGKDRACGNQFIHAAAARKRHKNHANRAHNAETRAERIGKHSGKCESNQNEEGGCDKGNALCNKESDGATCRKP